MGCLQVCRRTVCGVWTRVRSAVSYGRSFQGQRALIYEVVGYAFGPLYYEDGNQVWYVCRRVTKRKDSALAPRQITLMYRHEESSLILFG